MYAWERIDPKQDSTLRLVHECAKRGHDVAITYPHNLTIRESVTLSYCHTIVPCESISRSMTTFHRSVQFEKCMRALRDFDVILMRDNPPMDPFVLNFLDSVKNHAFIMNAVDGLREANNKIYTAAYNDPVNDFIPVTHVSKNIDYLLHIIKENPKDKMIMKPLDGYGGSGVIVIEKSAMHNIKSLLEFYIRRHNTESNYIILQEYIDGAEDGDIRVLMLDGKPIGALRRKPVIGDIRSNISAGGNVERYRLTTADKALCKRVGERLIQDGIYFAGLDIINGKLIEINVLSPGTITDINRLYTTNLQIKIIDYIERVVEKRPIENAIISDE